jgi:hypothetical protein
MAEQAVDDSAAGDRAAGDRAADASAAGDRAAGDWASGDAARREARLMARVAEDARVKGRKPDEAVAAIGDIVRYTFEYPADTYTESVHAHIERLWCEGHVEVAFRNCWAAPTWKGISTSWQEAETGQLFEIQFHTPESLAAREATYPAYQRLRDPVTTDAERAAIMAWLREAYAGAPAARAPAAEKARAERLPARQLQSERARPRWDSPPTAPRACDPSFPHPSGERAARATYYAITDHYSSEDAPAGVLRRVERSAPAGGQDAGEQRDEAFGRDLHWRHTFLLYSWERGNLDNSLHVISEDRAARITDRIRREVTRTA